MFVFICLFAQAQQVALSRSDQEKKNAEDEVKEEVRLSEKCSLNLKMDKHYIKTAKLKHALHGHSGFIKLLKSPVKCNCNSTWSALILIRPELQAKYSIIYSV